MDRKKEIKILLVMSLLFAASYFLPVDGARFSMAVQDALVLLKWYSREHVVLCLIPAFFIAGVIYVFFSRATVLRYLGANAKKWLAYLLASVAGSVLAVCSCTILPLFSGIYKRGAGTGPAMTFLYAGPGINILAIILTARILGPELGVARVLGSVVFSIVIGLLMHLFFLREEKRKAGTQPDIPVADQSTPLYLTAFLFLSLIVILVFANWGMPDAQTGVWYLMWEHKWWMAAVGGLMFMISLIRVLELHALKVILSGSVVVATAILSGNPTLAFIAATALTAILLGQSKGDPREWLYATWDFAKQILPLLAIGVLVAGLLLGSPQNGRGLVPEKWVLSMVGGNSLFANFFASLVGAFMYFATLTEVPIIQGLLASGMGKGPALALLLAGPALSLPNMLVIRNVIGTRKTIVFVSLVVVMATATGFLFGLFYEEV